MLGNMLVVYYRLTRKVIRDNIYVQYIIYCTVYSMCYDGSEGLYCKMVRAREKAIWKWGWENIYVCGSSV